VVFSFDALFGLTWRMLTPCYEYNPVASSIYDHLVFLLVISLYALINNVLSLCMIMAVIALLIGRSQSFASLHLHRVWALLVHPTSKNQSYSKESTINSYAWHFKPFQVNFRVLPFKTFKILLICDIVFSSWGCSAWVCYLPY
jgi:hypothetical protein